MDVWPQSDAPQAEVDETRSQRRRRRTQRALLDAGVDVIAEVGLNHLTIASITEGADVALGSFYNHFEDRSHYLHVLFIEQTMDWIDEVRAVRRGPFDSEAERFAAAIITLVRKARHRPAWGVFLSEALGSADLSGDSDLAALLTPPLERGIEQGVFTVEHTALAARLTVGIVRQSLLHLQEHGQYLQEHGQARESGAGGDIEFGLARTLLRTLGTPESDIDAIVGRAAALMTES